MSTDAIEKRMRETCDGTGFEPLQTILKRSLLKIFSTSNEYPFEALQMIMKHNLNESRSITDGKAGQTTILTGFRGLDMMPG